MSPFTAYSPKAAAFASFSKFTGFPSFFSSIAPNSVFCIRRLQAYATIPFLLSTVSGKVTLDGRPLLWKNRDTDYLRNHVAYVKGEKYDFIADVNSDNFPDLKEAWVGTNSAGFALMNTQSYNLVEVKDGEERGAANGRIIYRALEVCATVEDFCHFLDTITKPSLIYGA